MSTGDTLPNRPKPKAELQKCTVSFLTSCCPWSKWASENDKPWPLLVLTPPSATHEHNALRSTTPSSTTPSAASSPARATPPFLSSSDELLAPASPGSALPAPPPLPHHPQGLGSSVSRPSAPQQRKRIHIRSLLVAHYSILHCGPFHSHNCGHHRSPIHRGPLQHHGPLHHLRPPNARPHMDTMRFGLMSINWPYLRIRDSTGMIEITWILHRGHHRGRRDTDTL